MLWEEAKVFSERTRNALVVLVAMVWGGNILIGWVNPEYKPDPAINGIFSGMIGAVLAASGGKKEKEAESAKKDEGS